jgi:hypothetical protein
MRNLRESRHINCELSDFQQFLLLEILLNSHIMLEKPDSKEEVDHDDEIEQDYNDS